MNIRTMIAHENHDQRGLVLKVSKRDEFSVCVRQVKIGRGRARAAGMVEGVNAMRNYQAKAPKSE